MNGEVGVGVGGFEGWGLRDFLIKGEGLSKKCRRS